MRGRSSFDPSHLDIEVFAERAAELEGELPVERLRRLVESCHPDSPPAPDETVVWHALGERRVVRGSGAQDWMHLRAGTSIRLTCQRCLQAVPYRLDVDRDFRFVADEADAAAVDLESDADVLVASRAFDLLALVEDELLLALPLVPRHEDACPNPLLAPADPVAAAIAAAPRDKPFAALAGMKLRKTSG